jgi:serpin B
VTESTDPNGMHSIRPLTVEEEILLNSSNEFSFELLRMLDKNAPEDNILFSSLGVGNGIGMSLNILELKPKEELKNFLKISEVRDIEINKSYYELGRMLNYVDLAYYDADVNYMNFENPKNLRKINQWAENRTYGKIHQVVDTIIPSDKSYIINLLYFDISKALPFKKVIPAPILFNTLDGDRFECVGLNLKDGVYKKYVQEDFVLLDIPLGRGQFNLTMIIPDRYDGLNKMIENLTPDLVDGYLNLTTESTEDLILPDFEINSEIRLKSLFPDFGLTGPLRVIEGYYPTQNLFISDFIHKTHFNLSKEIESTQNDMELTFLDPAYVIDKPFIFIVREKYTGAIVFTGKLAEPVNGSLE